jgi:pimeloyl-ACP methyl ester carboxylesterase
VALISVVVLIVASVAAAWGEAAAAGSTDAIVWGACADSRLEDAGARCGYLPVPLDYARPDGPKIQLAIARVARKTDESRYQGVMLVNPGGPGASGLVFAIFGQFVPAGAGDAYDWIGFDPRGVGASTPALSCLPDYFAPSRPDYVPSRRGLERAWLTRSRLYASACAEHAGELLAHMTTIDQALDMDSIRRALGATHINYYGFSYGTYLGQVYSTMFPDRVRRIVLDSNVDPRRIWYESGLDQDGAFETVVKRWFAWLARYDAVYHLGATPEAVETLWYRVQDELRRQPAGGAIGPAEWTDIFTPVGYGDFAWEGAADTFTDWVSRGDVEALTARYRATATGENLFAAYNAVQCTDAPWPTRWIRWRDDNEEIAAGAPFITWANVWFNAPCLFWPAPARQPLTIDGRDVAGALLIGETLDAATPFEGSLEVRRRYPGASLIGLPGGVTHANSLAGNTCVDDRIAEYLSTGTLPTRVPGDGPDVVCEPSAEPAPGSTAAATRAGSRAGAGLRVPAPPR